MQEEIENFKLFRPRYFVHRHLIMQSKFGMAIGDIWQILHTGEEFQSLKSPVRNKEIHLIVITAKDYGYSYT